MNDRGHSDSIFDQQNKVKLNNRFYNPRRNEYQITNSIINNLIYRVMMQARMILAISNGSFRRAILGTLYNWDLFVVPFYELLAIYIILTEVITLGLSIGALGVLKLGTGVDHINRMFGAMPLESGGFYISLAVFTLVSLYYITRGKQIVIRGMMKKISVIKDDISLWDIFSLSKDYMLESKSVPTYSMGSILLVWKILFHLVGVGVIWGIQYSLYWLFHQVINDISVFDVSILGILLLTSIYLISKLGVSIYRKYMQKVDSDTESNEGEETSLYRIICVHLCYMAIIVLLIIGIIYLIGHIYSSGPNTSNIASNISSLQGF
ncbi:hypothetical protein NEOKW01_0896 [Nematocida sp. AWRm80]|nr:hypothetical protein NEOKW01_0896 [Nematocida sp. AWRm80]